WSASMPRIEAGTPGANRIASRSEPGTPRRPRRGDSIRQAPPLPVWITDPGSGVFELALRVVAIQQQHGRSALAGQGERHLGGEQQPGLVAAGPAHPDAPLLRGLSYGLLQRWRQCG